ncbi:hypothetical protein DXT77_05745 [Pseudomonas sp. 91RF]|jgi:hypothetical protein|uniref:hypothetical protein n=1 Tax=Pseudomonas sp. 91RF TaxID=2292261 RepID=UPI000E66DAB7|nr:hypothetical protein [Pseudomonas sp. 91RF]RIJ12033.1 hypothetical protein DXT77_05745 [Pseudomonas sp. 91RF]
MHTYSPSTGAFNAQSEDNVQLSNQEFQALFAAQSSGKQIVPGPEGKPIATDPVPYTREQIERLRNAAYSDIQTGTDRLFAEVSRLKLMNEPGWEDAQARAVARYQEIQAEFPWPEDPEPEPSQAP